MASHLQRELDRLKDRLLFIGSIVEGALDKAVTALIERDANLAKQVIADDDEIDRLEVELEEDCLKILALYQPVAGELRYVISILKMNNDLERMGDLAKNIAKRARYIAKADPFPFPYDFRVIAHAAQDMVKRCLDALVNSDNDMARKVRQDDDKLDAMRSEVRDLVAANIRAHPERTDTLMKYNSVAKHFERLGDMATNVAEDVIYMLSGEIVRHRDEGE